MTQKTPPLTFTEALNIYFGGVHGLENQPLPFKCSCGATTTPAIDEDGCQINKGIMNLSDVWEHIRKAHKERIKNQKEEPKPIQATI